MLGETKEVVNVPRTRMVAWPVERVLSAVSEYDKLELSTGRHKRCCARCDRILVTYRSWKALSYDERASARIVYTPYSARGLCQGCYNGLRNNDPDNLIAYERASVSHEEFVEDYKIYYRRTTSKRQIAKLMGMSWSAFHKQYDRARKRGDL